jgi:hypothetical protein
MEVLVWIGNGMLEVAEPTWGSCNGSIYFILEEVVLTKDESASRPLPEAQMVFLTNVCYQSFS